MRAHFNQQWLEPAAVGDPEKLFVADYEVIGIRMEVFLIQQVALDVHFSRIVNRFGLVCKVEIVAHLEATTALLTAATVAEVDGVA